MNPIVTKHDNVDWVKKTIPQSKISQQKPGDSPTWTRNGKILFNKKPSDLQQIEKPTSAESKTPEEINKDLNLTWNKQEKNNTSHNIPACIYPKKMKAQMKWFQFKIWEQS